MSRLLMVVAAMMLCLTALPAGAQISTEAAHPTARPTPRPTTGGIFGKVIQDRAPAAGVEVKLLQPSASGPVVVATTLTNPEGNFRFVDLPAGLYGVSATSGGDFAARRVPVRPGSRNRVLLNLRTPPAP